MRVHLCRNAVASLVLTGCMAGGGSEPPSGWTSFEQKLELDLDGHTIPMPLEAMDLWLTEDDEYPETFEIHGAGTSLGGTFPKDVRVGYEDNWSVLIGRPITISMKHATPYEEKTSVLTVPGVGPVDVIGGQFTIEKVEPDWDAKVPITGSIELRVRANGSEITLRGRLAVKGTGWG